MNETNKKTMPLVLLCEKSSNAAVFESVYICVSKICSAVDRYLDEGSRVNIKMLLYTFSSDVEKSGERISSIADIDIDKCMTTNTISISRLYDILIKDLSRSTTLAGEPGLCAPLIILIADGHSHYVQGEKAKEQYFAENRFLAWAKKVVVSIGEPVTNTNDILESFAGKDDVVVLAEEVSVSELIRNYIQGIEMLDLAMHTSGYIWDRSDDGRSIIQDAMGIVEVDPFDEEIEACTDDTDWGSNQDWE